MRKTYTDTQLRQLMQVAHQRRLFAEARTDCISLANEQGELLYVNEAYARRHGCDPIELVGRNLLDLVLLDDRDAVRSQLAAALCTDQVLESASRIIEGGTASAWIYWQNNRVIGPSGERWLYSVGRGLERDFVVADKGRCVLNVTFVPLSAGEEAMPDSRRAARRDPLTGLLNTTGLHGFLAARCRAGEARTLAVLRIRLDHLGAVKAGHGHTAADELLRQFGQRLQSVLRPSDAVARLGGDEFAIALTQVRELAHAKAVVDKVMAVASWPFDLGAATLIELNASVGVALDAGDSQDWRGLIDRAEAGIQLGKGAARSRWA